MVEDATSNNRVDLDGLLDLQTPWCLMVAATLRIPEHIAHGHADIAGLAERPAATLMPCTPSLLIS